MKITKAILCKVIYKTINGKLLPGEHSRKYSHNVIENIVNEFVFVLGEELKIKHPVELRDFGSFNIVVSKSRKARNFKTGETIIIPEQRRIKFVPSRALTDPPAEIKKCQYESECPSRVATIIKRDGIPIRICRYYYRCPSKTQDLFQDIPEFHNEAKVLLVTTGELIRGRIIGTDSIPSTHVPIVIVHFERFGNPKLQRPQDYIMTIPKDSEKPNFISGAADVSFNNRLNKCYVRNEKYDYEFEINQPVFKHNEILKILLNVKFK